MRVRLASAPTYTAVWNQRNAICLADVAVTVVLVKDQGEWKWQAAMDRDHVIATLRAHEPELKAAGIVRLRLFGSVARGDNSADSDLDIAVDFDESNGVSLLDLVRLENRLSDLLGVHIDLVQSKTLKTRVRRNVEREAVLAF